MIIKVSNGEIATEIDTDNLSNIEEIRFNELMQKYLQLTQTLLDLKIIARGITDNETNSKDEEISQEINIFSRLIATEANRIMSVLP